MRNPEITKKTSTPMNPPANPGTSAWASKTSTTATARMPWMSQRYPFLWGGSGPSTAAPMTAPGRIIRGS